MPSSTDPIGVAEHISAISSGGGDTDEARAAAWVAIYQSVPDPVERAALLAALGLSGCRDLAVAYLQAKVDK